MTSADPVPPATAVAVHSLRQRLLWLLLATVSLFALAQALGAYRSALQQADALFDLQLKQMAHAMQTRVLSGPGLETIEDDPLGLLVQIWTADGVQLFPSSQSLLPQTAVLGFSDVQAQGRSFRVYTVQSPLQTVQIAQDLSGRNAHARVLAWRAALPALLLAPLLLLAVWAVVTRSLRPLERARGQLAARVADDLSPLDAAGLPLEVQPLVQELNALFSRVEQAFAAQKSFVADAAHELRSPLAALKLQAQAVARQRVAAAETASASGPIDIPLQRLQHGIDRAIQLVEQLLVLARAEAAGATAAIEPVDLRQLLRLAVADVLPQAHEAGIDLGAPQAAATDSPLPPLQGQPEALRMLLRNLLDNAIKYSPAPGRVDVGWTLAEGGIVLMVDDSGPGIALADRERVFDRFFRTDAARGQQPGSGLGLAIVKAIAQQHGAVVSLATAPVLGGLRVQVRFPLPPVGGVA